MPSIVFMLVAYAWNISVTSRGDLKVEVLAIVALSQAANFRTNVLSISANSASGKSGIIFRDQRDHSVF